MNAGTVVSVLIAPGTYRSQPGRYPIHPGRLYVLQSVTTPLHPPSTSTPERSRPCEINAGTIFAFLVTEIPGQEIINCNLRPSRSLKSLKQHKRDLLRLRLTTACSSPSNAAESRRTSTR